MKTILKTLFLSLCLAANSWAIDERKNDHDDHSYEPIPEEEHGEHNHQAHEDAGVVHGEADVDSHDDHGHNEDEHSHEDDRHNAEAKVNQADHSEHEGHDDEHANEVHLRPEQLKILGIRTLRLSPRSIGQTLSAPGEVRNNTYATARVAPRISAQVTARQAYLGDHVKTGQPLVTLSSVELAEAQGAAVVAYREWQRVSRLGKKVVSESRYLEAQVAQQQSRARVISYGMTSKQTDELLRAGSAKANGSFVLLAPRDGTVIADDFVIGEVIDAGRTLFEITDESVRWIEARLAPTEAARVAVGNLARIAIDSGLLEGRVTQIHHLLDETTRTRAVRIEVPDREHRLHPGQFVEVSLESGEGLPVLALPESAVVRSPDGDWQVFVAGDEPGAFEPVEIKRVSNAGDLVVIEGLAPDTEVVIHGAFFLASELAKGGFDPHNH